MNGAPWHLSGWSYRRTLFSSQYLRYVTVTSFLTEPETCHPRTPDGGATMSQNHFTLRFPMKSPEDAKAATDQLPALMPQLFAAADAIGTIHYSRFTLLSDKT